MFPLREASLTAFPYQMLGARRNRTVTLSGPVCGAITRGRLGAKSGRPTRFSPVSENTPRSFLRPRPPAADLRRGTDAGPAALRAIQRGLVAGEKNAWPTRLWRAGTGPATMGRQGPTFRSGLGSGCFSFRTTEMTKSRTRNSAKWLKRLQSFPNTRTVSPRV